jgi:RNA polymerase sigma-70 factor (ECF subfamily)
MDTLPPDYKAVLIMHYTDDMTFEEIATVLVRPMNTVKSWHHRAIGKIREILMPRYANNNPRHSAP